MSYLHIERAAEKIDCPFPCLQAERSDHHITKPRKKNRKELTTEIEDGKKKIRQFENREKMLRQKLSKEEGDCVPDFLFNKN